MDQGWRNEAACRDEDPNAFYPVSADDYMLVNVSGGNPQKVPPRVWALCPTCPVRAQCYATGMAQRPQERQGWWGGVDVEVEFRRRKRIA